MVQTYPSYVNLLKGSQIAEGSKDDPLVSLKEKLYKLGNERVFDLICPFFSVVAQRIPEEEEFLVV